MQLSKWFILATIGLFVFSPAAVTMASAEDLPPCGSFTLWGGKFEVKTMDFDEEGDSVGDERIGERELMDADGKIVGMLRWVSHIVDVDEGDGDDDIALNQDVFSLPGGTLNADGLVLFDNAMGTDTEPTNPKLIAVVGGTGAFVKSQGEIAASFDPGKPSRYDFRLYCD